VRIGIARDEAFHFYYEDNLRRLESHGAELVGFSPVRDARLPEVDGLYFGGGYPEAEAVRLSANQPMLAGIREFAARGGPIYAECGGLMYLSEAIRTTDGRAHPMAGVLPGEARMAERIQALAYVEVETRAPSILGPAGTRFRGHEFRCSTLELGEGAPVARAYAVRAQFGGAEFAEGFTTRNVVASYVHAHWASNPAIAAALVESCRGWRKSRAGAGQDRASGNA
jgi:cobyrinic acid a,c-diamide synthase